MDYSLDDFFIVLCASKDGSIEFNTANVVGDVARFLDRPKIAACSDKAGISVARTHLLEKTLKAIEDKGIKNDGFIHALWIDSDIRVLGQAEQIAKDIEIAKENKWSLVSNYHGVWENGTYINTLAKPNDTGSYTFYSDEEIAGLKDLQELPIGTVGGMGFCYLRIPVGYIFSFTQYGEDINLFRYLYDTFPDFRLHFWDIRMLHLKQLPI